MNSAMRPNTRNKGKRIPVYIKLMISDSLTNPLRGGTPAMRSMRRWPWRRWRRA